MNYPRSCRHTHPQPSNLTETEIKARKLASNSDTGTYEIEISEGISLENSSCKERNSKAKCPYFDSWYPNFFNKSTTESSVEIRSRDQVYKVPNAATYYCEPHDKKPNCSKPKKCSHVQVQCPPRQEKKQSPPRCGPQRGALREHCKQQGEQSRSKVHSEERKDKNNKESKLPPCDCRDCKDDRCDGYKSSRTYIVSSKESVSERSKSKEGARSECGEKKKKEPNFQHFIEKLCSDTEKEESMSRPRSACEHDDCPCFTTNDRLKEVNKRLEALEAVYKKPTDLTDEADIKSQKSQKSHAVQDLSDEPDIKSQRSQKSQKSHAVADLSDEPDIKSQKSQKSQKSHAVADLSDEPDIKSQKSQKSQKSHAVPDISDEPDAKSQKSQKSLKSQQTQKTQKSKDTLKTFDDEEDSKTLISQDVKSISKKGSKKEIPKKLDEEEQHEEHEPEQREQSEPPKKAKRETKRETISKYEDKEQTKKIRKESKTITKFDEDPKRVRKESIYVESRYETTEDGDSITPDITPDPDFTKTAEEIENELLEIRHRLQKLEAIHTEREKVKASAVPASAVTEVTEVPVYSTIMYQPETQWHQVTGISDKEATETTTDTTPTTTDDSNKNINNLIGDNAGDVHEDSLKEKKSGENITEHNNENDKAVEVQLNNDGLCCCCKNCVDNRERRLSGVEGEEATEEECLSNRSHKSHQSNQKIKENFMIICKILRNKLSYLLRSDKRKRKLIKKEKFKASSETNLSNKTSSTKNLIAPQNSSVSLKTSKSFTTSSGTRILYQRDFKHIPSFLTYTKGETTFSSETAPLPSVCNYNSDETDRNFDSDKTYLCDGKEKVHWQCNARFDEDRNMNEIIYYLQSGDSSSSSIKNLKEYLSPNFFDFESNKNYPFPKYEKNPGNSTFYEEYDNRKEIIYTTHDDNPRFQHRECQCSGLGSRSEVASRKEEENHPVVVKESKNEKDESHPFEFLSSEGLIKIPVLFEELCKKSAERHPDSKVTTKVILVALAEEVRKENDSKKLVRNFSQTESSEEKRKFAFGVSKCDCERSIADMERSTFLSTRTSKSSAQLFMASRESLKSNVIIPMENELSSAPKPQINQKSIKCRCCHCNGEYPCPNVLNHVDPPNLVGLKRTLKDLGFSSLSEKLDDKIDFTKIIKKTQAVYSAPLNKIRKKREVSLSKSDEKIKSYISELAESLKESKICPCQLQNISIGPETESQIPYDEESKYAEIMRRKEESKYAEIMARREESKYADEESKYADIMTRKEEERFRMRYEPSDVPIKVQSEVSDVRKGMNTNRSQNGKLPVISINIKTTIYGEQPVVKEFDVTTDEGPQSYEPKRRISSEKSIRTSEESQNTEKRLIESFESETAKDKYSSIDSECPSEFCPRPRKDSTKTMLSQPLSDSSKSLEITIESKRSLETIRPEESASYRRVITSKDSIEITKKKKSSRGENGGVKKASLVVTPEEEAVMRRLRELETRLSVIEKTKNDLEKNEIPREVEKNSVVQSEKSVKFSKNNHAKTVFLALFRPFRYHKSDEIEPKGSKTKVFFKSSVEKLYGLKSRFSKSKKIGKEVEDKAPDDVVDGLIDDCSRSSPPLSKRKVPLVMESVEPIRAGKKSKKKKKKSKADKKAEDKVEKKAAKTKRKKKSKIF